LAGSPRYRLVELKEGGRERGGEKKAGRAGRGVARQCRDVYQVWLLDSFLYAVPPFRKKKKERKNVAIPQQPLDAEEWRGFAYMLLTRPRKKKKKEGGERKGGGDSVRARDGPISGGSIVAGAACGILFSACDWRGGKGKKEGRKKRRGACRVGCFRLEPLNLFFAALTDLKKEKRGEKRGQRKGRERAVSRLCGGWVLKGGISISHYFSGRATVRKERGKREREGDAYRCRHRPWRFLHVRFKKKKERGGGIEWPRMPGLVRARSNASEGGRRKSGAGRSDPRPGSPVLIREEKGEERDSQTSSWES